jgi:hypothetical protein
MKEFNRISVACLFLVAIFGATALGGPTSFTSDDFNSHNLKRPLWSLTNPLGDCRILMQGVNTGDAVIEFSVPAGSSHSFTGGSNDVPRIMQACQDNTFQAEIKFNSAIVEGSGSVTGQGIMVEGTGGDAIAFGYSTGDGGNYSVFALTSTDGFGSYNVPLYKNIAPYGASPTWLRVARNKTNNYWKVYTSPNGVTWTLADSFQVVLTASKIGAYVLNEGSTPQAFTSTIDYFFNTDAVINPEDGATNVVDIWRPVVHSVKTELASNAARISWYTDEDALSEIDYGFSPTYTDYILDANRVTSHQMVLTGLATGVPYYFQAASDDAGGRRDSIGPNAITLPPAVIDVTSSSDDFHGTGLNAGIWTFTDPKGDVVPNVSNGELVMPLPAGTEHNLWSSGYNVPRVMQPMPDADFKIFARFKTQPTGTASQFQFEGLLVEQDANNLASFNIANDGGTGVNITAIFFSDGLSNPETKLDFNIPSPPAGSPVILHVERTGALWKVFYSFNGTSYSQVGGAFYHFMTVSKVGVHAGNTAIGLSSPPAFNCRLDWFWGALPAKAATASPAVGAVDVPVPALLKWYTVAGVAGLTGPTYRLQVSTDSLFSAGLIYNDNTLTDTSKAVPGLLTTTKYYWRVRGENSAGNGVYSPIASFTTSVASPAVPTLVSPANGSTGLDTSLTLIWRRPASTLSFRLQVGTDSNFVSGIALNDSTITDTVATVSGLAYSTKYYWRVNAKNAGGSSAFSAKWAFTTAAAVPSVPVLLSPANNATGQPTSLVFRWGSSVPAATSYFLQVATDQNFVSGLVVDDSLITDTTKAVSGLTNNTAYYWRVAAKKGGRTSAFAARWQVTTIVATPGAPVLVSPASGAIDQLSTVTLRWTRPAGSLSFRVQVGTDPTFASGILVNDSTVTDTARVVAGLQFNTQYHWRVSAKNAGGVSSFSGVSNFRTLTADPTVPVQLTPANGATGLPTDVMLTWTRPSGATSFRLQLGTNSSFTSGIILDDPAVTDTFKSVASLSYLTTYYWRINADNPGGTSPFSPVSNFRTGIPLPATVTLVGPSNGALVGIDSVRLVWRKSSPQIDKYQLDWAIDSLFAFRVTDSSLVDSFVVKKGLTPNQSYFWRVRARNAGGWGAFSEQRKVVAKVTGIAELRDMPKEFALNQNYPNPFNPSTQIEFALPRETHVTLEVYNLLGEKIATLVDEVRQAGYHQVRFSAERMSSGIYLYRLSTNEYTTIRKMMLLK